MRKVVLLIFLTVLVVLGCNDMGIDLPPLSASVPSIDYYHGKKIVDPYRNLENLKDTNVISWLKNQEIYASKLIQSINGREELIDKLRDFDNRNKFDIKDIKITKNKTNFYVKKTDDPTVEKLFYQDNISKKEVLLYSSSSFKFEDDQSYFINYIKPDWQGEKVAVSLSKRGEDISKIIVVDVDSKKVISEILENAKPSNGGIQWLPDNSGFIFIQHKNTDPQSKEYLLDSKSVIYKIGDNVNDLKEIFSKSNNPDLRLQPEDYPKVFIYQDYHDYAFAQVSGSSRYKDMYFVSIKELLSDKKPIWKPLFKKTDKIGRILVDQDSIIYFSNKYSSYGGIYKTSIKTPDFDNTKVLIHPLDKSIITDFEINREGLFFVRFKNGVQSKLYHLNKKEEKEIDLGETYGSIYISSNGTKYSGLLISPGGWLNDYDLFHFDSLTGTKESIDIYTKISSKEYKGLIVKELEVPSHDGTKVPLSLIYHKDMKQNGKNHTLFYGYGSYGGAGTPFFNPQLLRWVTEGGILAIAHVRGGGEKGEVWYKGGFKTTKPNTWKDMIACTEFMFKENYTSAEKSAIWGSSAGGIMAGRAMTDRPDLYSAVILTSPAMNMLRCEIQPNGSNSIKEFGTVEIKEEFEALLEMDSYHHIEEGVSYPATYITTGMKDGRVVAWDPAKFAARLQNANSSKKPIVLSVDFDAGHGASNNSKDKMYSMFADAYAFAFWQTGHPDYQLK